MKYFKCVVFIKGRRYNLSRLVHICDSIAIVADVVVSKSAVRLFAVNFTREVRLLSSLSVTHSPPLLFFRCRHCLAEDQRIQLSCSAWAYSNIFFFVSYCSYCSYCLPMSFHFCPENAGKKTYWGNCDVFTFYYHVSCLFWEKYVCVC